MTTVRYFRLLRLASSDKCDVYIKTKYGDWKIHNRSIRKRLVESHVVEFKRSSGPFDTWVMCVNGQWVGSWHDKTTKTLITRSVFCALIAMEEKQG